MPSFDLQDFDPVSFTRDLSPVTATHTLDAELRVGVRPTAVGPGRAAVELEAMNRPHLGWLATLADSAMGIAFAETLGEGWICTTVSMRIDIVDGPLRADVAVVAFGSVLSSQGTVNCIMMQEDRIVARAVGRFVPIDTPLPTEATGVSSLQSEGLDLATGLGLHAAWAREMDISFDASAHHANPRGVVHGGLQMALAAEALERSFTEYPDGHIVDLSARFFAPAAAEATLTFRARRLSSGRRLAVARADVVRQDGRIATTVEATFRAAKP